MRAIIRDSGLPALTYNPAGREVTISSEGAMATYTIVPATVPSANLTVNLSSSDTDSVTVSPPSMTFTVGTNGDWETAKTVTVTGVADDDEFNDQAYIRHRTTFDGDIISWASVQVTVTDGNRAPFFEDGLETTREVPENAGQGAEVGTPVVATDLNAIDTLTYELDDDSGLFEIDSDGQISVSVTDPPVAQPFDYETGDQDYSVDVVVSDQHGLEDKIDVKVLVTNVNEAPSITRTTGDDAFSYPENTSIATVLRRYTATDVDVGDSITWSVEGTGNDNFAMDASGNLRFKNSPDHEATPSYTINIVATDEGNPSEGDELRAELEVTVTVTDVDEPPEIFVGDTRHDYDENSPQPVDQYFARDPENVSSIANWSLSGTDSGDFEISSAGLLTFKNTPDFERPVDSGGNNVYNVQVRATDDATPPKTGTLDVTVTVKDRNEAPTVTGDDTLSFPEGTATIRVLDRYTATDPERSPVTWSLSSRSGNDAEAFRIDTSGNLFFDGTPDHETPSDSDGDNVYDIQVAATDDGKRGDGTASQRGAMVGSFDVTVTVTNVDEPPVITGTTTIDEYDENGTGDVADYGANDPETAGNNNDDQVTWSLAGPDRGDFDISNSGVLTFKNVPDYDSPADSGGNNHYEVTIQATDSTSKRGEVHVDVIVKNVDEPPEIIGPDTVDDFPENSSTSRQVARYTASDPEGARVGLNLSSGDADFNLASNGAVTFEASPDYEVQSIFTFTVRAEAGSHTVNVPVTVNIQNLEEPGTVTLSTVQPQEDILLTATLEDGDGANGTKWQWYRASSQSSSGTAVTGASSATYTPIGDDVARYLRVVATYDDPHGDDKTVAAVSANRVLAVNPDNLPPEFPAGGDYTRSIRENLSAGRNVGAPVRATDANSDDRLTYSIGDSDYFEIADSTGQLRTKAVLDHEDEDEHRITVTATDPGNLRTAVDVTITVENVDEHPEISGPNSLEVAENGGTSAATYTATDPGRQGHRLDADRLRRPCLHSQQRRRPIL